MLQRELGLARVKEACAWEHQSMCCSGVRRYRRHSHWPSELASHDAMAMRFLSSCSLITIAPTLASLGIEREELQRSGLVSLYSFDDEALDQEARFERKRFLPLLSSSALVATYSPTTPPHSNSSGDVAMKGDPEAQCEITTDANAKCEEAVPDPPIMKKMSSNKEIAKDEPKKEQCVMM